MKRVLLFKIRNLKNNEMLSFATRSVGIVKECYTTALPTRISNFVNAHGEYKSAMVGDKPEMHNLALLDEEMNKAWSAMNLQLRASLVHPRNDVIKAAEKLKTILDEVGNPRTLSYDSTYGAIGKALLRIEALPSDIIPTSRSDEYFARLKAAFDQFTHARNHNDQTRATIERNRVRNTRDALTQAYNEMIQYLEALSDDDENISTIIDRLNAIIAPIRQRVNNRHGKAQGETTAHGTVSESATDTTSRPTDSDSTDADTDSDTTPSTSDDDGTISFED